MSGNENDIPTCAKCGSDGWDWYDLDWHDWCPTCQDKYVQCDDNACVALKEPMTWAEVYNAYIHWRSHENMHGCSHGQ